VFPFATYNIEDKHHQKNCSPTETTMKKTITLFLFLLMPAILLAQTGVSISLQLQGEVIRTMGSLSPGTRVVLGGITNHSVQGPYANILHANGTEQVEIGQVLRYFKFEPRNLEEFWSVKSLENNVYSNLTKYGYQYNLRSDMETEVFDYYQYLESNDLFIHDNYLEHYIQTLALELFSGTLSDGRTGAFSVKIVKDISPNASVYTNGSLLINSGLLSLIESEEELVAVLAHELAHFVLDHSIININAAMRRQLRGEFWAALATGVAAVADIYQGSRNPYHNTGELTGATAVVSLAVADMITERMGMKFTRAQETDADKVAAELLAFTGRNPDALSSVLFKLREFHTGVGNYMALQGRSHPSVNERIAALGNPGNYKSTGYDARISFVNTFNARQFLLTKNFKSAGDLARRNITAGVAVEDDFLVLAAINLATSNDDQSNREALQYINTAKALNIYPPVGIYKQEALVMFRLGYNGDAEEILKTYLEKLFEQELISGSTQHLSREIEWTTKMIARARFL
jgi:beta-barrel assembly-enhancing protease